MLDSHYGLDDGTFFGALRCCHTLTHWVVCWLQCDVVVVFVNDFVTAQVGMARPHGRPQARTHAGERAAAHTMRTGGGCCSTLCYRWIEAAGRAGPGVKHIARWAGCDSGASVT